MVLAMIKDMALFPKPFHVFEGLDGAGAVDAEHLFFLVDHGGVVLPKKGFDEYLRIYDRNIEPRPDYVVVRIPLGKPHGVAFQLFPGSRRLFRIKPRFFEKVLAIDENFRSGEIGNSVHLPSIFSEFETGGKNVVLVFPLVHEGFQIQEFPLGPSGPYKYDKGREYVRAGSAQLGAFSLVLTSGAAGGRIVASTTWRSPIDNRRDAAKKLKKSLTIL